MWESRTCDNLTVIHRVRSETMWPLFRQRKQADNTSHSYDITRRSYWATENRLFDTVFRFIPRSFPLFFCHERTNVCGISIRTSKETAFNSFRKYKEKYNISRQYNITQPALLSLRFGYYLWGIKFFFLHVRSFHFLYGGNASKEKRNSRFKDLYRNCWSVTDYLLCDFCKRNDKISLLILNIKRDNWIPW